ncbi:MAG: pyruvate carboxylase subunit B [Bacillota bacterium]|nr:pyruvate carboxylase subunit B [Bacillota bacterium]
MNRVYLTDTTFRDAQQSMLATRLTTEELLSIAGDMNRVGFYAMEVWGGATFDACLRYLNEDPWLRLRAIKEKVKDTKASMLLRGQSLLGYQHYPDDIVEKFITYAYNNGINIFRIFDVLDDFRNLELPVKAAKKVGANVQGQILYTKSPIHSIEKYVELALELEKMGVDAIVFEDMAGLMSPFDAEKLCVSLLPELKVPLFLHCHSTSGMAMMTYLKAVESGVRYLDTAMSPLAMGTSNPATETMVAALKDSMYDTRLDLELLKIINEKLYTVLEGHNSIPNRFLQVDVNVLTYQIPGGMLSNLYAQLQQYNATDKFQQVLDEVPRVREELGYPPLATPASQFVGAQAANNVLSGERYKIIPKEVKNYIRGFYGKPPGEIDPKVMKKAIGDEEPITCRPADLFEPAWDKIRAELDSSLVEKEEDYLTYAMFPQVARDFFEKRKGSI